MTGLADAMKYADRAAAGRRLGRRLMHLKEKQPLVLALPRGGVAVGYEIARLLAAPLDVVLVRKIGVPWQPELALGAVADGARPEIFIDRELADGLSIPQSYIEEETARQIAEVERRRNMYCGRRAPAEFAGRTAIVVDDGVATGATMRVALRSARRRGPARLVLAVPVAAPDTFARLAAEVDEAVVPAAAQGFGRHRLLLPRLPPAERRRGDRPPDPHHLSFYQAASRWWASLSDQTSAAASPGCTGPAK